MSDRYTRTDAENALERLAAALGKPLGHYRKLRGGEVSTFGSDTYTTIPGGWALDYNPTYGGCVIEEIDDRGGTSVRRPLGDRRMSPREFVDSVWFALNAIELYRRPQSTPARSDTL